MAHAHYLNTARKVGFGAVLGLLGTVSFVGTASAVTVTADFNFTGSGYAWSPTYTVGGLTLGVEGFNYADITDPGDVGDPATLTQQIGVSLNTNGLGACSAATSPDDTNCGSRPLLDGQNDAEMLRFTFGQAVTVTGVLFANNDQNDHVDFFAGDNLEFLLSTNTPLPPDRFDLSFYGPVTQFAVGNQTAADQYRIASISVSYEMIPPPPPPNPVPLPAAGWMLIAGLGGLAAARRRRKA